MNPRFLFFTSPQSFFGDLCDIQVNAIRSWQKIGVEKKIILFGSEYGTSHYARELHCEHIPEPIARDEFGSPYLSFLFQTVESLGHEDILVYVDPHCVIHEACGKVFESLCSSFSQFYASANCLVPSNELTANQSQDMNITGFKELSMHQFATPRRAGLIAITKKTFDYIAPITMNYPYADQWFLQEAFSKNIPRADISKAVKAVFHGSGNASSLWGSEFRERRSSEICQNVQSAEGTSGLIPRHGFTHLSNLHCKLQRNPFQDLTEYYALEKNREQTIRKRCDRLLELVNIVLENDDSAALAHVPSLLLYISVAAPDYHPEMVKLYLAASLIGLGHEAEGENFLTQIKDNPEAVFRASRLHSALYKTIFNSEERIQYG